MKTSKKIISLLLALLLLVGGTIATITVSAAGDTVYVKVPSTYGVPNCYMWNSASDQDVAWPGTKMTFVEDGIYSYTPSKSFANVIFNNGSSQTADLVYPGAGMLYDLSMGTWSEYSVGPKAPMVTISVKDGASFKTETLSVHITVSDADSAYYTVDGGSKVSFTNSADVTLGASTAVGGTTTLFVSATNSVGTTTSTATYTKKDPSSSSSGGATSGALGGYYSTNPDGQVGKKASISVDGSLSDWNSSMLIAQGTANDDPRVYRPNSMYEVGIDLYALYAAYDDSNLYLMWEMTNVQDVVAPNDNYPLSQGVLWQTQELPFFIAVDTGDTDTAIGNKGALTTGGTIWNSGMTFDSSFNKLISINTKGGNGPWVYGGDSTGLNPVEILDRSSSKITMDYGLGILSDNVYGINGAYGEYNGRVYGDIQDESSDWVDFNTKGHKSSTMDFFYELSIPFSELGITVNDVESNGIGVMLVATMGKSPMDCLPGDLCMTDQAHLDDGENSQEHNSFEKSDEDNISVPFARVGKLLTGGTTPTPPTPPTPTQPQPTQPQPTQPDNPGTPGTIYYLGDASLNEIVNVKDATLIQKVAAGLEPAFSEAAAKCADANLDGEVNVMDATAIQKYVAGLSVKTPIGEAI